MDQKNDIKTCAKCGSLLIEVTSNSAHLENSQIMMTKKTYRCSDDACQKEIDKRTADLAQQRLERENRLLAKKQS